MNVCVRACVCVCVCLPVRVYVRRNTCVCVCGIVYILLQVNVICCKICSAALRTILNFGRTIGVCNEYVLYIEFYTTVK